MRIFIALLLVAFSVGVLAQTGFPKFTATYSAVEDFLDNNGNPAQRQFQGSFFYQADWNEATGTGRDRLKFLIRLESGQVTKNLEELTVFEDQFFKFTICDGDCAWQDIFAEDPFPRLHWLPTDTNSVGTETVNGRATEIFEVDGRNSVNDVFNNWVRIWVRTGNERWVEKCEINYSDGVTRTLTFSDQRDTFSSNQLRIPDNCPDIEPGCFRLDLVFVIDLSGSVRPNGPEQEILFISQLTEQFLIDPKHLACGLVSFSYCRDTEIRAPVTYVRSVWEAALAESYEADGFTCIIGGIQRGFWSFATENGSRPATAKSLIVLTDGNGNRPCNHVGCYQQPNSDCNEFGNIPSNAFGGALDSSCVGRSSPCNAGSCCQGMHNFHLSEFYNLFYDLYRPTIYAIGVGQSVSSATLEQIINDPGAIAAGEPRKFNVDDFAELNTIISVIVAAILCDIPGSNECPNDCRPDGFCCAGGCICSVDCSLLSTDCQEGYCRTNNNGAVCDRGPINQAACQFGVQCNDVECVADTGCVLTPNPNLECTDNNDCTDNFCSVEGICERVVNDTVTECNDFNDCTTNDACLPNGDCEGTINDLQDCDDGDDCTTTACRSGECTTIDETECTDDDTSDCIISVCDPDTGICEKQAVEEGVVCRPNTSGDNCTVFICDKFDPEDYDECVIRNGGDDTDCDKGECEERTRNLDECKSSDDNTAAIIGGVVAGVAVIAIIILLLIIFLLILCRKQVGSALGNLVAFGPKTNVVTSPTYATPAGEGVNAAFEG